MTVPRVVCFGEILWDIFEAPSRGGAGVAKRYVREIGGAPANVAVGLSRLGARGAVLGGVGRDRFGRELVDALAEEGVDTREVIWMDHRTGITFVSTGARGEPEFLFYRHESADVSVRAEQITAAGVAGEWLLVGTSTLMTKALEAATHRAVHLARAAGAKVVVDLNIRAHLWPDREAMHETVARLVAHATVVKASAADLAALGGGVEFLRQHAPTATWLVTRGARSASAIGMHGTVRVPAKRASCVDATGAGDAFLAGVLALLLAARAAPGRKIWQDQALWTAALGVGHALGAKAVARRGAVAGLSGLEGVRKQIQKWAE
jgi:fructokinase